MKIKKEDARRFIVAKQCFGLPSGDVSKEQIFSVLKALGCVQIDTINVIERSQYLVFWSRLGSYAKEYLDHLLYPDRRIFEYWAHAASIIPMEYYRFFLHAKKQRQKQTQHNIRRYLKGKASLIDMIMKEIKRNGPVCSKDFESEQKQKTREPGWWNWKPAKIALEILYDSGVLMISRREKFQKYYDLAERVLPSWVDINEPTETERQRFFIEKTLNAWGTAEPSDFGYYFYAWSTKTNVGVKALADLVKELEKEDVIKRVEVEGYDRTCFMLTRDSALLRKIISTSEQPHAVNFLSPFDNLTWGKPRMRKLFDFDTVLETYIPKASRKFGYYTLNILYGDQLVGRLDPKMHREKATLEIKAIELKPDFKPTKAFAEHFALTRRDFMKFHNAQTTKIPKNCHPMLRNAHFEL